MPAKEEYEIGELVIWHGIVWEVVSVNDDRLELAQTVEALTDEVIRYG